MPEAERRLKEARVLKSVTDHYQTTGEVLTKVRLNPAFAEEASGWFIGDDSIFDFEDLDSRSVKEYFDLE